MLVRVIDVGEATGGGHVAFAKRPPFVDVAVEALGHEVVIVTFFEQAAFGHVDAGASGHEVVGVFLPGLEGVEERILFFLVPQSI